MYVLGFDIGGTKCAVLLGRVTEEQVEFLGREQMDCRIEISYGGP